MRKRRAAAAALLAFAGGVGRAEEPAPKDDAARRAEIAKFGRLAWSGSKTPLEFCDLDGSNPVVSDAGPVSYVKWLPDGRRVLAGGTGRVYVVDAATGKSKDLTADLPDDRFPSWNPAVSPNGRYAVFWHSREGGAARQYRPFAYSVFDLDAGTRTDIGPVVADDASRPWTNGSPMAWWSPDGVLYAAVRTRAPAIDTAGTTWTIVRWTPADGKTELAAELPWGTRATHAAFHADAQGRTDRFAYVVQPEEARDLLPQVRLADGSTALDLASREQIWAITWEPDGAALRVRVAEPKGGQSILRAQPGRPATTVEEFKAPRRVPTGDPAFAIEQHDGRDEATSGIFRVATATGEALRIGPGSSPQRVGDVVVFWRVTVPSRKAEGPYFEEPKTIHGTDDLWAYDPADGAVIRVSDRGFTARCWDVRPTPEASRPR